MAFPNANWVRLDPLALGNDGSRVAFYREFQHFLANGWTHQRSGDGSAAFSSTPASPAIAHNGTGANGVNDGAWYVVRDPTGREIERVISLGTGTGSATVATNGGVVAPSTAQFTGGSATVRATSTEEGIFGSATTSVSNSDIASNTLKHLGAIETVAPYRFFFFGLRDNAALVANQRGRVKYGWYKDQMLQTDFASDSSPDRGIYCFGDTADPFATVLGGWSMFIYSDNAAPATGANFDPVIRNDSFVTAGVGAIPFDLAAFVAGDFIIRLSTGTIRSLPAHSMLKYMYASTTVLGSTGYWWALPEAFGGSLGVHGDAFSAGLLLVPWDQTTIYTGAAELFRRAYMSAPFSSNGEVSGIGGIADPPVLSALNPPGMSNLAPGDVITFSLTHPTEVSLASVYIKYANASRTYVVYDSQGFRFPFGDSTVESVDGSQLDFTLRATGGWESDIDELIIGAANGSILSIS